MDFIRRTDSSLKLQEKLSKEKQELLENVKREVGKFWFEEVISFRPFRRFSLEQRKSSHFTSPTVFAEVKMFRQRKYQLCFATGEERHLLRISRP